MAKGFFSHGAFVSTDTLAGRVGAKKAALKKKAAVAKKAAPKTAAVKKAAKKRK